MDKNTITTRGWIYKVKNPNVAIGFRKRASRLRFTAGKHALCCPKSRRAFRKAGGPVVRDKEKVGKKV